MKTAFFSTAARRRRTEAPQKVVRVSASSILLVVAIVGNLQQQCGHAFQLSPLSLRPASNEQSGRSVSGGSRRHPSAHSGWTARVVQPPSGRRGFARMSRLHPLSMASSPETDKDSAATTATIAGEGDVGSEQGILAALSAIIDPDQGSDIVSLGFVKDLDLLPIEEDEESFVVCFQLELATRDAGVKEQFKQQCKEVTEALPWVKEALVTIAVPAAPPAAAPAPAEEGGGLAAKQASSLSGVANIIAVSSCKGGVGKSTTTVNLAYTLAAQGKKVGILDADVYGPSLPTMVKPEQPTVEFLGESIVPLQKAGVKLMSYGYVNSGAAIMRGPMVVQLLQQFVGLTAWGELDYLLIDFPPGTGDIQLTLCQSLNITAAVIVTTPQKLSFTDVAKGIDMFDTVNIPSVAVVENMAYSREMQASPEEVGNAVEQIMEEVMSFSDEQVQEKMLAADGGGGGGGGEGDGSGSERASGKNPRALLAAQQVKEVVSHMTGKKRYVFGQGHKARLVDMWGIESIVQMPINSDIARSGDSGSPFVMSYPESEEAGLYRELAEEVVSEVDKIRSGGDVHPHISFGPSLKQQEAGGEEEGGGGGGEGGGAVGVMRIRIGDGPVEEMSAADLRRQCRCAACVEEFSGRQLLNPEDVSETIRPLAMAPIGNYAISVDWTDGHKSLYPYRNFVSGYKKKPVREAGGAGETDSASAAAAAAAAAAAGGGGDGDGAAAAE